MSDIETIEMHMEQVKAKIAEAGMLYRLLKNPDFQKFFMEGYLKNFAAEMVERKASMNGQDEKNQKFIDAQITAIGNVKLYMRLVEQEAAMAKEALTADEEERARILEEEK